MEHRDQRGNTVGDRTEPLRELSKPAPSYIFISSEHHPHRDEPSPVMTSAINDTISVTDSPSTLAPVLGQPHLVSIQIHRRSGRSVFSSNTVRTDTSLNTGSVHRSRPRVIDEQHPAAVAMSPYTESRKWEGHSSKATNEITRPNLEEKKTATHIKTGNGLVKKSPRTSLLQRARGQCARKKHQTVKILKSSSGSETA